MRKVLVLIVVSILFASLSVYAGGGQEETTTTTGEQKVHLGAITDITGADAALGLEIKRAIELYVELKNKGGGVEGYPLEISLVDGQSEPKVYATKAHRVIDSMKVVAAFGGNDISTATAAGKIFQDKKTAFLDIGGTTATIPLVGDYMFMTPTPDNDQGRAVAKYIQEDLGFDTISIFKDMSSAYGTKLTEYIEYFFKEFTNKEDCVPFIPTYNTGDTDYTAQLTRLKANIGPMGIQAIVLPMWPEDAPRLVKQARELGIELPFVGTDGPDTVVLAEIGGDAVEGMIMSTLYAKGQPGLPDGLVAFAQELENRYGEDLGSYGAMTWDALTIITTGIADAISSNGKEWWESASLEEKRVAVRDGIAAVDTNETSQPVSFTDVGSPTRGIVWKVVKNGERVFLEFKPYESFTPPGIDPMPFK